MVLRVVLEEHIAARPEEVYAAATDMEQWPRWMPNLIRIERLSGNAFADGTRWREFRKMFGTEAHEVFDVSGVVPGHSYVLTCDGANGTSRRGIFQFRYAFKSEAGGTTLALEGEISGLGLLTELLGRFFIGSFKGALAADLKALRQFVEGTHVKG